VHRQIDAFAEGEEPEVGSDVSQQGADDDDDAAHRGRAALVHVAAHVFLDELADAVVAEHPDRDRRHEDREGE